jgi:hypothetical protein
MPTQKRICPQAEQCDDKKCSAQKPHPFNSQGNKFNKERWHNCDDNSYCCPKCVPVAHKAKPKVKPTLAWGLKDSTGRIWAIRTTRDGIEEAEYEYYLRSDNDCEIVRVQLTEVKGRGK